MISYLTIIVNKNFVKNTYYIQRDYSKFLFFYNLFLAGRKIAQIGQTELPKPYITDFGGLPDGVRGEVCSKHKAYKKEIRQTANFFFYFYIVLTALIN